MLSVTEGRACPGHSEDTAHGVLTRVLVTHFHIFGMGFLQNHFLDNNCNEEYIAKVYVKSPQMTAVMEQKVMDFLLHHTVTFL